MTDKSAYQYGQEAFHNGINRICDDKTFMADFCQRKVGEPMPYMKQWQNGWYHEQEKDLRARFPEFANYVDNVMVK